LRQAISSAPRTRCVGRIPHAKVPMYMRAADVLVLPSFSEGMPTVLVEAGAAALPVVATAVGGIGELLSDGRGLLIPPDSVAALVTALETVLADPGSAMERAGRLKEYVGRNYDVEENARTMMRIYESLL
jgi:teichuronic acid biosynthesis glycosyltransferase TuaC